MKKLIAAAAGIDGKAFDYGNDLMNLFDRVQNGGGFNLREKLKIGVRPAICDSVTTSLRIIRMQASTQLYSKSWYSKTQHPDAKTLQRYGSTQRLAARSMRGPWPG
jgi:hypothetical protein